METKFKFGFFILLILGAAFMLMLFPEGSSIIVMNPKGLIGLKERDLMVTAIALMLIVVIPVCIMTVVFAWKYRASNAKAKYTPDWDYSLLAEAIWWGFPLVIILILSVLTWKSSHELDPFKPLDTHTKPLTIQVVALQWKWLFIYPEYNIATVNFIQFPEQTPLNFEISADAPMNSFWIPQLGGQIYAMPGMKTKLHLIANEQGSFRGSSANISGRGFSGMTFTAKATLQEEFDQWVKTVQESPVGLDRAEYKKLAEPSEYNPVSSYSLKDGELFDWIVMKETMPHKD